MLYFTRCPETRRESIYQIWSRRSSHRHKQPRQIFGQFVQGLRFLGVTFPLFTYCEQWKQSLESVSSDVAVVRMVYVLPRQPWWFWEISEASILEIWGAGTLMSTISSFLLLMCTSWYCDTVLWLSFRSSLDCSQVLDILKRTRARTPTLRWIDVTGKCY